MQDERGDGAALPRRRMLKVLAVAPAALAGCAAVTAEQPAGDASTRTSRAPAAARDAPADEALAAIRSFRLAPDAEPAVVFRAAAARPGEAW